MLALPGFCNAQSKFLALGNRQRVTRSGTRGYSSSESSERAPGCPPCERFGMEGEEVREGSFVCLVFRSVHSMFLLEVHSSNRRIVADAHGAEAWACGGVPACRCI